MAVVFKIPVYWCVMVMSLDEEFPTFRRTVVASSSASDCWTLKTNAL